jgi:hypothetical protein
MWRAFVALLVLVVVILAAVPMIVDWLANTPAVNP